MPSVVISIGAKLDADVNALFAPIEKRSEKARDAIAKALGEGLKKGFEGGVVRALGASIHDVVRDAFRDGMRDALKNFKMPPLALPPGASPGAGGGQPRVPSVGGGGGPYRGGRQPFIGPVPLTPAQEARAAEIVTRQQTRAAQQVSRAEARARSQDARALAREQAAEARDINRVSARRMQVAGAVGGAMSHAVSRGLRTVGGIGASLARGAGVKMDVGAYAAANVEAEKLATDIANSGYQAGAKGAAGMRQSPQMLMAEARDVGREHAYSQGAALEGLGKFTAKTGDLATGRAVMGDMARLSRATGTELDDMINAAGDVANALGDGFASAEEKALAVSDVMRSIAGQGKLGAVEISDMAVQMAKVASAAGSFGGDKKANIAMMGALAQEARQRGGAASATSAATSVGSFVSMLSTPARIKAMRAEGIEPMDKATHRLRDPRAIITEALIKTQGDPERLKKMFANAAGARPVMGFANIFRDAGGGKAGLAAVNEEFDKLIKIAMGEGEIAEAHNAAMATTAAQTELLNNRLQDMTGRLQAQIIPKLLEFAPALTRVLDFAATNPGQAATLAIGASIAQAGVGAAVSETIKAAIAGSATAGIAGLAITAAVVTIAAAKVLNDYDNDIKKGRAEGLGGLLATYQEQERAFKNAGTPEERKRARENLELTKQELEHYQASSEADAATPDGGPFGFGKTVSSYLNTLLGIQPLPGSGEINRQTIAESGAVGEQGGKVLTALQSIEATLKGMSTAGGFTLTPNAVAPVTITVKTALPVEVSPVGRTGSGPGLGKGRGYSPFFSPGYGFGSGGP